MANFRQVPVEQVKAKVAASQLADKPTSEQIRREAEELREFALKLMEHARLLIEKSVKLERAVAENGKRSRTQ